MPCSGSALNCRQSTGQTQVRPQSYGNFEVFWFLASSMTRGFVGFVLYATSGQYTSALDGVHGKCAMLQRTVPTKAEIYTVVLDTTYCTNHVRSYKSTDSVSAFVSSVGHVPGANGRPGFVFLERVPTSTIKSSRANPPSSSLSQSFCRTRSW